MTLHDNWALTNIYILASDVDALKFWQKASTDEYPTPPDIEIEAADCSELTVGSLWQLIVASYDTNS